MGDDDRKSKISLHSKSKSHIDKKKSSMQLDHRSASRLRMRKPSYGFSGVPGIRPVERTSNVNILYLFLWKYIH